MRVLSGSSPIKKPSKGLGMTMPVTKKEIWNYEVSGAGEHTVLRDGCMDGVFVGVSLCSLYLGFPSPQREMYVDYSYDSSS